MTFRRNGIGVARPVWIASADGQLYVVTDRTSAKMKRLRVTDRIRLAACDIRGKVHGDYADGHARIVDDLALIERATASLSRKYRLRFRLATFLSRRSGRIARRAWLEIILDETSR